MAKNEFQETQKIVNKAVDYKNNGDYNQAEEVLQKGLDKYPENNYLKASLADLFYRQKKLDKAFDLADEILSEKPGDTRALTVKGNVHFAKRDYKKAKEFFKEAYLNEKSAYTASRLIKVLNRLEEFERALELANKWREEVDDSTYFKKIAANIYEKIGENEKAEKLFSEYLKEKPEDQFAYKEKIKLKLENKDPKKAVEELKNILNIAKRDKNPHLHTLLAEKLEKIDEYEEAVKEYEKTLELDPDNKFALKQAGFTLYKLKNYEKALPYLKEVFRNDPGDYYTRSVLMNIFKELNKEKEGIEFFKEIIENNSGFENLWGMVKKLSKRLGEDNG